MNNPLESDYDHACDRLGRDLGLAYYGEDWGLCNQDPGRLSEFVEYFISRRDELGDLEQALLGELIMASADNGLAMAKGFDISPFKRFFRLTRDDPAQADNYDLFSEDVGSADESTPLAACLRRLMDED
ncbi:MAG: hypothetical protein KF787_01215 [Phycisphaeraceae bacterium]|nr:hypothetical protein [Phycisphaerae bacterium]MBX3391243.1 hypothetical protein [Phycisphaeraceae bacterium]